MQHPRSLDEYAPIAPLYDALVGWMLASVRREILQLVLSRGLHRVLDICSGTGEQVRMLHNAGVGVAGLDLSPAMLTVARTKGPSLIPYLRGDATALPFGDGVFDGIILSMSLHEKTPMARASMLGEARRVLKRGGTMLIADFNMPGHGVSRISHPFVHAVERLAGREHYRNFKSFIHQGGMASLLNGCGIHVQQFATFLVNTIAVATVSIQEAE